MNENKREFFRLDLYSHLVEVEFNGEVKEATIKDLSGNGIGIASEKKWDVFEKETRGIVRFELEKKEYELPILFIREMELDYDYFVYGCEFVHTPEKIKDKICTDLIRIQLKRR